MILLLQIILKALELFFVFPRRYSIKNQKKKGSHQRSEEQATKIEEFFLLTYK